MEVFANPLVLACVLAMPIVVIGLARAWKNYQKAAQEKNQARSEG